MTIEILQTFKHDLFRRNEETRISMLLCLYGYDCNYRTTMSPEKYAYYLCNFKWAKNGSLKKLQKAK